MVRFDMHREFIVSESLEPTGLGQAMSLALDLTDVHISVPMDALWTPQPGGLLRLNEGARVAVRGTTSSSVTLPFSLTGGEA